MKRKKICLMYKNEKIDLEVFECNWFERIIGLMFSRRRNAKILLFNFNKPTRKAIHSFFVFFPFVAVWLNKEGNIIDIKVVKPFTFYVCPLTYFFKLIEVPIIE